MPEKMIRVIVKEPYKPFFEMIIPNESKEFQRLVGGSIKVFIFQDCAILCNEDGRFEDLPINIIIDDISFAGTVVICGYPSDGYFCSVSDDVRRLFLLLNSTPFEGDD